MAKGFLVKMITLRERPTKGGRSKVKSMYEFTRLMKRNFFIRNEIKTHFGHPKPMANNQKSYLDDE